MQSNDQLTQKIEELEKENFSLARQLATMTRLRSFVSWMDKEVVRINRAISKRSKLITDNATREQREFELLRRISGVVDGWASRVPVGLPEGDELIFATIKRLEDLGQSEDGHCAVCHPLRPNTHEDGCPLAVAAEALTRMINFSDYNPASFRSPSILADD